VGPYLDLGEVTQRAGKVVRAWAFEGDCDPAALVSLPVPIEWPPRSGRIIQVPELDRVQFFAIDEGRRMINPAQVTLLDRLLAATRR
jgi:predicted NUDIX family NTP pyrophosphohydrolase